MGKQSQCTSLKMRVVGLNPESSNVSFFRWVLFLAFSCFFQLANVFGLSLCYFIHAFICSFIFPPLHLATSCYS